MRFFQIARSSCGTPARLAASTLAFVLSAGLAPAEVFAQAQTQTPPAAKKPAVRSANPAKTAKPAKALPKPVELVLPDATPEQTDAATRVYYGLYECEFKESVDISVNPKFAAYVDVRHGKTAYVMKPVLSSTGAIRLEDVKGQTLMVQIANKSMLLDVVAARRIVDDCVSPRQRELIEAARLAKIEAAAAASAALAASAAAAAVPPAVPASSASAAADSPTPSK